MTQADSSAASSVSCSFERGTVWLVGAGPGDARLLTLLAVEALQKADVVLYDSLVSRHVLSFADGARLECVGKRAGLPSATQEQITQRLIRLAREGNRVVRLKGGDPFVFGRGAEEARALAEAKIRFRIVPGITAGIGGLAYAGIPATARDTNQSLFFVVGHPSAQEDDRVNWEALGRLNQPLVIYMGKTRLRHIARRLLAGGLSPQTPMAILSKATLPEQEVIETTVAAALDNIESRRISSPALIVIGDTVRCRDVLHPYQIV